MKPKYPAHHRSLALLGIPFLFLSPVAPGADKDKVEEPAEVEETEETAEEKGEARLAEEVARRNKEAARQAEEVAKRVEEVAKRAEEAAKREEEAIKRTEQAARRVKEAAEDDEREADLKKEDPDAPDREKAPVPEPLPPAEMPDDAEKPNPPARGNEGREKPPVMRERPERRPAPAPDDEPDRRERPAPPDDGSKPPIEMPVVPSKPLQPRETTPERTPEAPAEPEIFETPATELEREAETEVAQTTREVQRDIEQRKTRIDGREDAQALINEILGAESRISRAEIAREERYRPRFERQRAGEERLREVSPDQRRAATTYYQERLLGREVEGPPPEFFRRSGQRGDTRDIRVVERVEFVRPRYLNEGRRYVHFDSRAAIPAILMAAQAMNQVRFQPTREIAPMFHEREEVSAPYAMPLPPESYRSADSWVVSYPVDENSMISSQDILFLQGSTQFSDPYSYEVIGVMADAMKSMPETERFVVEGHASAEGSYESNMILSQQRAEHIVREIVRRGVSPYRLLPVGYGESEARHADNAAEALRSQDRRVVVFRMKPELVAER